MRKLFSPVLVLLLTASLAWPADPAISPLWGSLQPGDYSVGFQAMSRYDPSRPYRRKYDYDGNLQSGNRSRPLQINVWYPAEKNAAARSMTFEDYLHLTAVEEKFGEITGVEKQQSKSAFQSRWGSQISADKFQPLYQTKMAAVADARPASGKFPLVLIAQSSGMSYPYGNSVLAEYLASHGYVVATAPALGPMRRQAAFDPVGVLAQMQDLQFIIGSLQNFPPVDNDKLALVGFSFGGMSTSLLAMQNTDVDAVISLDSAVANSFGYSVLFQNPLYEPHKFTAPILHFTTMDASPDASDSFFRSAKYADVRTIKLKGRALDFSTFGAIAAAVPGFAGAPADSKPGAVHDAVCAYSLHFLNATVKKQPEAKAFLDKKPSENGFSDELVASDFRRSLKVPPTEEQFVKIIEEKGVSFASNLYRDVITNDPDFELFDSRTLNALAQKYLADDNSKQAIEVGILNAEAHADDWEVHDMLGRAYMADGNNKKAIECFTKSLELNPENANATEMLKKLKQS